MKTFRTKLVPNTTSKKKDSYDLLVSEKGGEFKVHKSNITLQEALKESSSFGYKNLWLDIQKK